MDELSLSKYKEFVHFGLTSQDVNNTAIPLSLKDFLEAHYFPQIQKLIDNLKKVYFTQDGLISF
jgi:adenylosuccinate lyase